MKFNQLILMAIFFFLNSFQAFGADFGRTEMALDSSSLGDDAAAIYGLACEKIKPNEPKSSIRLRATDKASFEAVKNLAELSEFKSQANDHDLNVLVYTVVDNFVEDLAVRTTKQDDNEICVEITGYVKKKNITQAIANNDEVQPEAADDVDDNEFIDDGKDLNTQDNEKETLESKPDSAASLAHPLLLTTEQGEMQEDKKQKRLLYIAPVEFFNNTQSDSHKQILKDVFDKNDYFYLTENKETADYIINSKIMRAKVDPINSNTNRLQMVISVGVEFTDSGASTIEHQNRFILFANGDDEQEVAAKLMRKLLTKAGEQILNKIENDARKKMDNSSLPKIITPK